MQKRTIKTVLALLLVCLIAYNSVYFKKLDEVKAASATKQFDAVAYAGNFYTKKLMPSLNKAVDITELINLVKSDPQKAFAAYSHALGIGNIRYFLVRGRGTLASVDENAVSVVLHNDSTKKKITIATEFVYGNAIRDASGLIDINEFTNTMDFNNVSAGINRIVRSKVLPPFKSRAKAGDEISFTGALELNQAHVNLDNIEIVPIELIRISLNFDK